jgi:hypothetical protein
VAANLAFLPVTDVIRSSILIYSSSQFKTLRRFGLRTSSVDNAADRFGVGGPPSTLGTGIVDVRVGISPVSNTSRFVGTYHNTKSLLVRRRKFLDLHTPVLFFTFRENVLLVHPTIVTGALPGSLPPYQILEHPPYGPLLPCSVLPLSPLYLHRNPTMVQKEFNGV